MLRATFKSLLSRKLRLILSGLAVVLGVMFVSGSFVLTNTLSNSFHNLFANAYSHTSLQVSAKQKIDDSQAQNDTVTTVPASVINQITAVPGVASATGLVRSDGARAIGKNGKALVTAGAPQFGINWSGTSRISSIKTGRAPTAPNEIVIDNGVAKAGPFHIGDQIKISVHGVASSTFTVVGIFVYSGDRDSLGGEQTVAFTTPVAQQLMLDNPNAFSSIDVRPAGGLSDTALQDRVAKALGPDYVAKTGKQLAADQAATFSTLLGFVNDIFLGFAGVALFVGIFLILNTFSIIVAQRTKELALLRALGGSRKQMIGSVLTEAVVIGVLASTIGLGAGVGVGALLAYVFTHVGGGSLQLAGLSVPASAVIASYAVGVTITLIAALLPALRASRIAPIAAMRDAATPDRPLTRLTIVGSVIFAAGAALLGIGPLRRRRQHARADRQRRRRVVHRHRVLTPAISRPIVSALGSLFSWFIPGQLGKRNSARNPRRTAITAAALMVGIALIIGVNVVLSSAKTSISSIATTTVKADLVITSGSNTQPVGFDPSVLTKTAAIPGVHEVAGIYEDRAEINGKVTGLGAINDPRALTDVFSLKPAAGTIATIDSGQIVVDQPDRHEVRAAGRQRCHGADDQRRVAHLHALRHLREEPVDRRLDHQHGRRRELPRRRTRAGLHPAHRRHPRRTGESRGHPAAERQPGSQRRRLQRLRQATGGQPRLGADVHPDPAGARHRDRDPRRHQHARALRARTHPRDRPAPGDRHVAEPDDGHGDGRVGGDLGVRRGARGRRRRRPGRLDRAGAARPGHQGSDAAVHADDRDLDPCRRSSAWSRRSCRRSGPRARTCSPRSATSDPLAVDD